MKIIDLFSGIGGFSLAGHKMGWETSLFCEIAKFPQEVLKKNFPGIPIHDDITTLNKEKIYHYDPSIDPTKSILTGGFPCQPFSTAGKRLGEKDNRYLWPEMCRIIREFQPAWVVGENVGRIVQMDEGRTLERILFELESEGYNLQVFLIPACSLGAIHRRDRIWIIANSNRLNARSQVRGKPEKTKGVQEKYWKEYSTGNGTSRKGNDIGKNKNTRVEFGGISGGKFSYIRPPIEPAVCRGDNGISGWVDGRKLSPKTHTQERLKSLGNAIVHQIAHQIFEAIKAYEEIKKDGSRS